MNSVGLHWFRRDLRVAGNPGLRENLKKSHGRVLGLFCFDKKFLDRDDFSVNRFQFFLHSLMELKNELKQLGGDLLVLDEGPQLSFPQLHKFFQAKNQEITCITWNRDYEPFARERDSWVQKYLDTQGVTYKSFRDHLLIEPWELNKSNSGEGYQVYSPFAKKWLEIFQRQEVQRRIQTHRRGFNYLNDLANGSVRKVFNIQWSDILGKGSPFEDHLEVYRERNSEKVTVPIPKAGSLAGFEAAEKFVDKIDQYLEQRDFPSVSGTSRLSLFLKNGSLTIPQIIALYNLKSYKKPISGENRYLSELIWREFYYHILWRHPEVENQAFLEKYRGIRWPNNLDWFEKWKRGQTGFPIVDAGMRELLSTGWMHNRVRMIVASFLTKDLLIDWKWGEKYFMDQLLDGDLAPNNGGWQWAASTGCDPQPYFRIFNPWLQSAKFDKDGEYIKKFIPELREWPSKLLHQPIIGHSKYPKPIVDHKVQRAKALKLYS